MFWSHDYAERIVVDADQPAPSHVWFLTRYGSFKEFSNPATEDANHRRLYQNRAPSDEFRRLYFVTTTSTWELQSLDGRTDYFLADGRWDRTVFSKDPGHAIQGHYNGSGQLDAVTLPDGRSDTFTYYASGPSAGKLHEIIGTPVAGSGTATRTWTLTWNGDELQQIDRPDSTSLQFYYDPTRPGYLTRIDLVGGTSLRILAAFDYQSGTNVVEHSWRGDPSFTGANAVDKVTYAYDDSTQPTLVTMSRQITNAATPLVLDTKLHLGRDTASAKPRVEEIDGTCSNDGKCGGITSPKTTFAYEGSNVLLPSSTTDAFGIRTAYTYDGNGRVLSKIEDADNVNGLMRQTTYTYGNASFPGLVTLVTVPSTTSGQIRTTGFGYDATGFLQSHAITGYEGSPTPAAFSYTTSYTPNSSGEVVTIDPPGIFSPSDVTTFTYDEALLPGRNGHVPTSRTDPIVGTTSFDYDGFNRRTVVVDPGGARSETTYDPLDRVLTTTRKGSASDAPPTADLVTTNVYNALGDLFCVELPGSNGVRNAIQYDYDVAAQLAVAGRLAAVTRGTLVAIPDATHCVDTTKPREVTLYSYDNAGHRIQVQLERCTGSGCSAPDSTTTYEYSCNLDRMTQGAGSARPSVTDYCYDAENRLQTVWDAIHSPTAIPSASYTYDELHRLKTVTIGQGSSNPATTAYDYDVQDHLASVQDAEGNVTTYTTSDRDLLTKEASPAFSGATPFTIYGYNEHGQLTTRTDPRGITLTRQVDALDRITAEQYPTSSANLTYVYDGPGGTPTGFARGRLFSLTRDTTTTSYVYDRFGRMLQDGALAYTYDGNGNRATITYPGGAKATYTFDFADRPASLTGFDGTTSHPLVTDVSYAASGPLTGLTLGNGLVETRTFDARYFPSAIQLGSGGSLLNWQYGVDDVGNVTGITGSTTRTFAYEDSTAHDGQYFLTSATGPWGTRSWSYDRIGNRTQEIHDGITDTYAYTGSGHTPLLQQVTVGGGGTSRSYTYDAAGDIQQVSGANVTFTWDDGGRMSQAARAGGDAAHFTLDGRGFLAFTVNDAVGPVLPFLDGFESGLPCAWSAQEGYGGAVCPPQPAHHAAQPVYDSAGILQELDTISASTRIFYFGGRPVALLRGSSSPTWSYLTADHLGTPIAETDGSGAMQWSGGFEPFGRDWQAGGSNGAHANGIFLRLPGQWSDPSWADATLGIELFAQPFRWYEPQTGRYTSPDPLYSEPNFLAIASRSGSVGTTAVLRALGGSGYAYAQLNPTRFTDPLGLATCDGTWRRWDYWNFGDPPTSDVRPVRPGQLPPAGPIPGQQGPNPVSPRPPVPIPLIPPGVCFCSWFCDPCKGGVIFDPRHLPVTIGYSINTGYDPTSGDECLCAPPDRQTGCPPPKCPKPTPTPTPTATPRP